MDEGKRRDETGGSVATGWVVGPGGRLRRATKHHMGRRLPTWDYRRPAYYVVTIVLADRRDPKLGEFTPGLESVYCAVMPDHLHLLVKVVCELKRPLGNAIGGFKTGCEKIYRQLGGEGW